MDKLTLEEIKAQLCGKRIVAVEASEWSGVVRSLTTNSGYVSLLLDDGTTIEAGALFIHEDKQQPSHAVGSSSRRPD